MSPLKGNAIAIFSVLLSSTSCIYVKVIAEYTFQVNYVSTLSLVYSSDFSRFISEALMERSFSKKTKKESYEKASRRSWRPRVAGCQKKKTKTVPIPEEKQEKKKQKGRPYVEGGKKDNCTTRWWLKAVFLNKSRIPTGKRCETLSKYVSTRTRRVLSRRRQD